jgi:hypothetical protein
VAAQVEAIDAADPGLAGLYRALGRRTADLAHAKTPALDLAAVEVALGG